MPETKLKPPSQLKLDQWAFAEGISALLYHVFGNARAGFYRQYGAKEVKLRLDDFNRPDKKGHMPNSRHYERCAADIILDVDNVYITDSFHPIYLEMGKFWESLNPRFRWGGKFRTPDGNHFSIASIDGKRA